jgi:hypothetical protein
VAAVAPDKTDPLHRLTTTFGGHPCGQIWADLLLWELVLNDRLDLCAIVEFGTWQGGFSRFLFAQAAIRNMDFVTYDSTVPDNEPPGFEHLDIFAHRPRVEARLASYDGPVILLCDNGNKPREVRVFPPALPPDSLVVVHDWMTEFLPDDVPPFLVELYGDVCDSLGSMSRVFEMKRGDRDRRRAGLSAGR